MISFVIDPDDTGDCYGKYRRSKQNIPDGWEIVEVENLDDYNIVEWRYEQ